MESSDKRYKQHTEQTFLYRKNIYNSRGRKNEYKKEFRKG